MSPSSRAAPDGPIPLSRISPLPVSVTGLLRPLSPGGESVGFRSSRLGGCVDLELSVHPSSGGHSLGSGSRRR